MRFVVARARARARGGRADLSRSLTPLLPLHSRTLTWPPKAKNTFRSAIAPSTGSHAQLTARVVAPATGEASRVTTTTPTAPSWATVPAVRNQDTSARPRAWARAHTVAATAGPARDPAQVSFPPAACASERAPAWARMTHRRPSRVQMMAVVRWRPPAPRAAAATSDSSTADGTAAARREKREAE